MTNATITLLGNYDLNGNNLNNAVIQNGLAYLPAAEQGLFVLDVKNAANPKLVKQLDALGYVYDVTVSGKTAFVVSESEGLKIVDVTNPAQANVLSTFTNSIGNLQQVAVANNIAYLADWEKGLLMVDVSNLNAPNFITSLPISHPKTIALARNNTLALIVSDSAELVIVDVTIPSTPKKLGALKLGNDVREIAVLDNDILAIATGENGLKIVNISNTSAPKLVGNLPLNFANAVTTIDKQKIGVANGATGLVMVDVSNPAKPKITDTLANTQGNSTEIMFSDAKIYLVNTDDDKQHLQIFSSSFSAPINETPVPPVVPPVKPPVEKVIELTRSNPNFQGKGEMADNVQGSEIPDSIWGGSGNDTLKGGSGNDKIDGYNGNDKLFGEQDSDSLMGGIGNDFLDGGDGDDNLDGGAGNDTLDGGTGADKMNGSEGDDYYFVDDIGDTITEGTSSKDGVDTVEISVDLQSKVFAGIENYLIKSERNVNAAGDDNANKITGGIGNNYLRGNGGNDTLIAGAGNDTLEGGKGKDVLNGGAGDDIYIIENEEDEIIDTEGDNQVQSSKTISIASYTTIKNLELTGNDAIDGTGNNNANFIEGNDSDNRLDGRGGNDELDGKDGDDTLVGGSGGDNMLKGGNGDDVALYLGSESDYSYDFVDGIYTVQKIGSSETDLLYDIETIKFSDREFPIVDKAGTLTLSVADMTVAEGGVATLTLKLDGNPTEPFTVNVKTANGTAENKDYTAFSQAVTFDVDQNSKQIKIKTIQDKLVEDTENFTVQFSSDAENIELANPVVFVTIEDDDKPKVSIANAKITEGQAGKSSVDLVVTLSEIVKQNVTVHYATTDGSAKQSSDYNAQVSDLTIKAGSKTGKISIPILDDNKGEAKESFNVTLSNAKGAILGNAIATVEITDNDISSSSAMKIELVGVETAGIL